ncbi:MAG TPA: hypothetical protein VFX30_12285 [bacterium]|nr:hypothetical protein [bacterium]
MVRLGIGAKIGLIVGLLGGLFGLIVAIGVAPVTGLITAIPIVVVFFFVYKSFIGPLFRAEKLLKEGEPGTALIKSVSDTGVTINNAPQVKIVLEVRPKFKPPYEATTKVLVSRIRPDYYRPGMTVAVRINPKNPNEVVIDPSGGADAGASQSLGGSPRAGGPSGVTEAQAIQTATEFEAFNQRLTASGESALAKIMQATPMGFTVNGNNPAMELLVEVEPAGKPKFLGRAQGVIAEASVPKYQPGKSIYVKFDPADTTRVAIDRSA